jgi:hypothetical protein
MGQTASSTQHDGAAIVDDGAGILQLDEERDAPLIAEFESVSQKIAAQEQIHIVNVTPRKISCNKHDVVFLEIFLGNVDMKKDGAKYALFLHRFAAQESEQSIADAKKALARARDEGRTTFLQRFATRQSKQSSAADPKTTPTWAHEWYAMRDRFPFVFVFTLTNEDGQRIVLGTDKLYYQKHPSLQADISFCDNLDRAIMQLIHLKLDCYNALLYKLDTYMAHGKDILPVFDVKLTLQEMKARNDRDWWEMLENLVPFELTDTKEANDLMEMKTNPVLLKTAPPLKDLQRDGLFVDQKDDKPNKTGGFILRQSTVPIPYAWGFEHPYLPDDALLGCVAVAPAIELAVRSGNCRYYVVRTMARNTLSASDPATLLHPMSSLLGKHTVLMLEAGDNLYSVGFGYYGSRNQGTKERRPFRGNTMAAAKPVPAELQLGKRDFVGRSGWQHMGLTGLRRVGGQTLMNYLPTSKLHENQVAALYTPDYLLKGVARGVPGGKFDVWRQKGHSLSTKLVQPKLIEIIDFGTFEPKHLARLKKVLAKVTDMYQTMVHVSEKSKRLILDSKPCDEYDMDELLQMAKSEKLSENAADYRHKKANVCQRILSAKGLRMTHIDGKACANYTENALLCKQQGLDAAACDRADLAQLKKKSPYANDATLDKLKVCRDLFKQKHNTPMAPFEPTYAPPTEHIEAYNQYIISMNDLVYSELVTQPIDKFGLCSAQSPGNCSSFVEYIFQESLTCSVKALGISDPLSCRRTDGTTPDCGQIDSQWPPLPSLPPMPVEAQLHRKRHIDGDAINFKRQRNADVDVDVNNTDNDMMDL